MMINQFVFKKGYNQINMTIMKILVYRQFINKHNILIDLQRKRDYSEMVQRRIDSVMINQIP